MQMFCNTHLFNNVQGVVEYISIACNCSLEPQHQASSNFITVIQSFTNHFQEKLGMLWDEMVAGQRKRSNGREATQGGFNRKEAKGSVGLRKSGDEG